MRAGRRTPSFATRSAKLTRKTKSAYLMALFLDPALEEFDEKIAGLFALAKSFAAVLDVVRQQSSTVPAVAAARTDRATSTAG